MQDKEKIRDYIRQNYAEIARQGSSGACLNSGYGMLRE